MSGFDSLCFTDCRAGEGLAAGPGFGFRATSPGVDPAVLRIVQDACLYEPPDAWMDEQRAVADYPRSLAHVSRDGRFVTASGRYLGIEVKGSLREGNHFTHALSTDTVERYGQVRPAQLWSSPVWRDGPGEGTGWPPVAAPPDPGPLEPPVLQRWVADQPGGEAMLLAVGSALERVREGGPRLLFVADDPYPVLAWVAAATLLMPRPDALGIGFKVFSRDVGAGSHDVVALHTDWAGGFRGAATRRGFAVFDLVAGVRSEVPAADAAGFWVPRFLAHECFDVLDAVELSGVFRTGAVPGRAERLAAAALALDEQPAGPDLDVVLGWLTASAAATLPSRRRRELLERLLAAGPDARQLRGLAGLADRLDQASVRDRIRWHVFAREVDAAVGAGGRADPYTPAGATRELEARLAAAAPDQVPGLLAIAGNYGLDPDPTRSRAGLRRFARWWVDGALDVPGVEGWSCRDVVHDLVRDELAGRLRGAPAVSRQAVGELWWPRLWPTVRDARSDLDATLAAAATARGTPDERRQVAEHILLGLGSPPPADALDVAWAALYALRPPDPDELLAVLHRLGPDVTPAPRTVHAMAAALDAAPAPTPQHVAVLRLFADRGIGLEAGRLAAWQQQAQEVGRLTGLLAGWDGAAPTVSPDALEAVNTRLARVSVEVLRATAREVVDALARLTPQAGAEVLVQAAVTKRAALTGHLERALPDHPDVPTAALAFAVATRIADVERTAALRLRESLRAAAAVFDDHDRRAVGDRLDPRLLERWQALCTAGPARRRRGLLPWKNRAGR